MTNSKTSHKSIRIFTLMIAVTLMMVFAFSPVRAFASAKVKLNVSSKTLVKDTTYTLKVYNLSDSQRVVFSSEDSDIATVKSSGLVTAVSNGTTVISVYIYDDGDLTDTLTCRITVGPPAISVRLTKSEVTLEQGKKTLLRTIVYPNNTVESVKFCVADTSVATISAGGQITARSVGETYALALINNGKWDICKITVTEPTPVKTTVSVDEAVPTASSAETASEAVDERASYYYRGE